MDKVLQENLNKFLSNVHLMFGLVKSYVEDDKDQGELVRLLKTQHSLNESLLIDLGYRSDDSTKIRRLNEQVRELEAQLGNQADMSYETVARFLSAASNKFSKVISCTGINASAGFKMNDYIEASIKFYGVDEKYSDRIMSFHKNEAEKAEAERKHNEGVAAFKQNFDYFAAQSRGYSGSLHLKYNERNTQTLVNLCSEFFGEPISHIEYELRFDEDELYISEFKFGVVCTQQGKNFQRAFAER